MSYCLWWRFLLYFNISSSLDTVADISSPLIQVASWGGYVFSSLQLRQSPLLPAVTSGPLCVDSALLFATATFIFQVKMLQYRTLSGDGHRPSQTQSQCEGHTFRTPTTLVASDHSTLVFSDNSHTVLVVSNTCCLSADQQYMSSF